MGLLQKKRIFKPSNKLTKKQQQLFLKLLADLLANGFNIINCQIKLDNSSLHM